MCVGFHVHCAEFTCIYVRVPRALCGIHVQRIVLDMCIQSIACKVIFFQFSVIHRLVYRLIAVDYLVEFLFQACSSCAQRCEILPFHSLFSLCHEDFTFCAYQWYVCSCVSGPFCQKCLFISYDPQPRATSGY